jgi:acetyl-CoA acetyltransferase
LIEEFGTKAEHLGAIAINQRSNAVHNEKAIKREPLTMDEYMSSRMIVDPLRLLDITLESDGACALLVTTSDWNDPLELHRSEECNLSVLTGVLV